MLGLLLLLLHETALELVVSDSCSMHLSLLVRFVFEWTTATFSMCRGRNKWNRSFSSTKPKCIISRGMCVSLLFVPTSQSITKLSLEITTGWPKIIHRNHCKLGSSIRPHSTQQPVPMSPFLHGRIYIKTVPTYDLRVSYTYSNPFLPLFS